METVLFFKRCFHDFCENMESFVTIKSPGSIKRLPLGNVPLISESMYIDQRVVKEIQQKIRFVFTQNINIMGIDIFVNLYGSSEEDINKVKATIFLCICSYIVFALKRFPSLQPSRTLSLEIYLTNLKKEVPRDQSALSPIHVNTGLTINMNKIVIYRKEEVIKVLIHELTHYLGIDEMVFEHELEKHIKSRFNLESTLHLHEAYTDFLVCKINTAFYSIFDRKSLIIYEDTTYIKYFKRNLAKESKFIKTQAHKVMLYNKYCDLNSIQRSHEKTHVVSYYIVKSIMMSKWEEYIRLYDNISSKEEFYKLLIRDLPLIDAYYCQEQHNTFIPKGTLKMTSLDVLKKQNLKTI